MRSLARVSLLTLTVVLLSVPAQAAESRRFELSVVVDGVALPEFPWRDRTYVEALRGRPFSLRVSNPTPGRVAVAISVDGRNIVDARRTSARQAAKWVLEAGQTLEIPGWQISGETARHFFFTETARSYAKWLGDTANVGTIEAVFFRERRRPPVPLTEPHGRYDRDQKLDREEGDEGDAPRDRSAQNAAPKSQTQAPAAEVGGALKESIQSRPTEDDRYAATGIGERTGFPVQRVEFREEPNPAASIALRYEFRRELVRLGVLPRRDDLSARERARGFEPEYAPDPDRHRSQ
jgi:hypothetical protein